VGCGCVPRKSGSDWNIPTVDRRWQLIQRSAVTVNAAEKKNIMMLISDVRSYITSRDLCFASLSLHSHCQRRKVVHDRSEIRFEVKSVWQAYWPQMSWRKLVCDQRQWFMSVCSSSAAASTLHLRPLETGRSAGPQTSVGWRQRCQLWRCPAVATVLPHFVTISFSNAVSFVTDENDIMIHAFSELISSRAMKNDNEYLYWFSR